MKVFFLYQASPHILPTFSGCSGTYTVPVFQYLTVRQNEVCTLLPQTVPFFELLVQQNALLQEMSEALAVVMDNTEASERI